MWRLGEFLPLLALRIPQRIKIRIKFWITHIVWAHSGVTNAGGTGGIPGDCFVCRIVCLKSPDILLIFVRARKEGKEWTAFVIVNFIVKFVDSFVRKEKSFGSGEGSVATPIIWVFCRTIQRRFLHGIEIATKCFLLGLWLELIKYWVWHFGVFSAVQSDRSFLEIGPFAVAYLSRLWWQSVIMLKFWWGIIRVRWEHVVHVLIFDFLFLLIRVAQPYRTFPWHLLLIRILWVGRGELLAQVFILLDGVNRIGHVYLGGQRWL